MSRAYKELISAPFQGENLDWQGCPLGVGSPLQRAVSRGNTHQAGMLLSNSSLRRMCVQHVRSFPHPETEITAPSWSPILSPRGSKTLWMPQTWAGIQGDHFQAVRS